MFKYKVDGCFLWSTGSWDILAAYPESSTTEGSYFDPVVAQIIDRHNSAAREAGHAFIAPSRDSRSSVRKYRSGIGLRLQPVDSAAVSNGCGGASTGNTASASRAAGSYEIDEKQRGSGSSA